MCPLTTVARAATASFAAAVTHGPQQQRGQSHAPRHVTVAQPALQLCVAAAHPGARIRRLRADPQQRLHGHLRRSHSTHLSERDTLR